MLKPPPTLEFNCMALYIWRMAVCKTVQDFILYILQKIDCSFPSTLTELAKSFPQSPRILSSTMVSWSSWGQRLKPSAKAAFVKCSLCCCVPALLQLPTNPQVLLGFWWHTEEACFRTLSCARELLPSTPRKKTFLFLELKEDFFFFCYCCRSILYKVRLIKKNTNCTRQLLSAPKRIATFNFIALKSILAFHLLKTI